MEIVPDLEAEKRRAALAAVDEVRDGMCVGLGTGSTAEHAVRELGSRVADGLRIIGVATSRRTDALARSLAIPLVEMAQVSSIDLTIDGADEIDAALRAIKGGGGAMMREKIVAAASDRVIIAADSSKLVATLGRFRLPVEVLPFASSYARRELDSLCSATEQRRLENGEPYLTDQGAYIFDLGFGQIEDPEGVAAALQSIPGVIAHGLFLKEIDMAVIGVGEETNVLVRRGQPQQAGSPSTTRRSQ